MPEPGHFEEDTDGVCIALMRLKGCFESRTANTIHMRQEKSRVSMLSLRFVILTAIFFAANLVALAQSTPFVQTTEPSRSVPSEQPGGPTDPRFPSPLSPLKQQVLEALYHPITPAQRLHWFVTSTIGLPHLAGEVFVSACGTALDRPAEYGPHWGGFADRFGMGMAGSVTGNAIEASAGLVLREVTATPTANVD